MRLEAARRAGPATAGQSGGARGAAGGFALASSGAALGPAATSAPTQLFALDNLVMLQSVDAPAERRRAKAKGGRLLDHLDALKLALLSGAPTEGEMAKLRAELDRRDDAYSAAEIADIMAAIDLRARVELAKRERG
jgi:hypothetical protein